MLPYPPRVVIYTPHYKISGKDTFGGAELTGRGLSFIRSNGIAVTKTEYGPAHVKPQAGMVL